MTALLDHARTVVRQVQLTVVASNARAVAFYERHGFVRYGVEPDSIRTGAGFADEALMWRKL
jgi:ribosomal protein S18 acetylase RimI-like enzyme